MPKIEKTQVVCVAELRAKEGKTDELIGATHPLMQPTTRNPAVCATSSTSAPTNPRWITYLEK